MRRVNVHLDEGLDDELRAEAARVGESKAALLRKAARALLDRRAAERGGEGWVGFTGAVGGVEHDDRHDDDVIYEP